MDSRDIQEFYVTFGMKYTLNPDKDGGERHPLGMHGQGFMVIEAPDLGTAQKIAQAIFDNKYAFTYDWEHFMGDGTWEQWYSKRYPEPLLTIKWAWPMKGVE